MIRRRFPVATQRDALQHCCNTARRAAARSYKRRNTTRRVATQQISHAATQLNALQPTRDGPPQLTDLPRLSACVRCSASDGHGAAPVPAARSRCPLADAIGAVAGGGGAIGGGTSREPGRDGNTRRLWGRSAQRDRHGPKSVANRWCGTTGRVAGQRDTVPESTPAEGGSPTVLPSGTVPRRSVCLSPQDGAKPLLLPWRRRAPASKSCRRSCAFSACSAVTCCWFDW